MCSVHKQITELDAKRKAAVRTPARGSIEEKITQLIDIRGLGVVSAQKLMHEVFYRSFDNRRQVGSYFALSRQRRRKLSRHRDQASAKPAIGAAELWRRARLAVAAV